MLCYEALIIRFFLLPQSPDRGPGGLAFSRWEVYTLYDETFISSFSNSTPWLLFFLRPLPPLWGIAFTVSVTFALVNSSERPGSSQASNSGERGGGRKLGEKKVEIKIKP